MDGWMGVLVPMVYGDRPWACLPVYFNTLKHTHLGLICTRDCVHTWVHEWKRMGRCNEHCFCACAWTWGGRPLSIDGSTSVCIRHLLTILRSVIHGHGTDPIASPDLHVRCSACINVYGCGSSTRILTLPPSPFVRPSSTCSSNLTTPSSFFILAISNAVLPLCVGGGVSEYRTLFSNTEPKSYTCCDHHKLLQKH